MHASDQHTLRAIHTELSRWGKWIEGNLDWEGYPRASAYADCIDEITKVDRARLTANGKQSRCVSSGHRVLMLDMPTSVYATDRRVYGLPDGLKRITWAYYVFHVALDGSTWSFQQKADMLQIPVGRFRQLIHEAKVQVAGLTVQHAGRQYLAEVGESVESPKQRPAA